MDNRTIGRTFLHVGAPKSGTTHLQQIMRVNARELARRGVHYPVEPAWSRTVLDPSFRAALDLTGQGWGGPPGHARGAWDRLARDVRTRPGTSIVSHEILAGADRAAVARAHHDLAGQEVHVVVTLRDLSRALPAAWQESIKQGRVWSYRRFLDRARRGNVWFLRAMDPTRVLETWGSAVPPERVHVVITPRVHDDQNLLWERFAAVLGIDPAIAVTEVDSNPSLGIHEVQLLRRLNRELGGRAHRGHLEHHIIDAVLTPGLRAGADDRTSRVRLPPRCHGWVSDLSSKWISWLEASGYDIVGDLDELRPEPTDPANWVDPDKSVDGPTAAMAAEGLAAVIRDAAERKYPLRTKIRRRLRRTA